MIDSENKDRFSKIFASTKIFLNSLLKMVTEGMKQLIDYARTDEEFNEASIDISEFKLGLLNRISNDAHSMS